VVCIYFRLSRICSCRLAELKGVQVTRLVATRVSAATYNQEQLDNCARPEMTFTATDHRVNGAPIAPLELMSALDNLQVPKVLVLRVGARVMLLRNISVGRGGDDLFNGLQGTVTALPHENDVNIHVLFDGISHPRPVSMCDFEVTDGSSTVKRSQYPAARMGDDHSQIHRPTI
jgi:hypothetical protein